MYIVSNHLSELNGDSENEDFTFNLKARFVDWVNELPLDSVKSQSLSLTQKTLHRARLLLLKSDNYLMKLIDKISQHNKLVNGNGGANNSAVDFWGDLAKKKKENQINAPAAPKIFDIKPVKKTFKNKKSPK